MVARTDGNTKYRTQASIIESKCVECGICAGSCDTAGVGIDSFASIEQRRRMEAWLKDAVDEGAEVRFAFSCAESAGAGLSVDPDTGLCAELPGYRVLQVPCIGWIHPLLIERALRNGAEGVLMVSCAPGECRYREGAEWAGQRLSGKREPALRPDKVDAEQVRVLGLDRTRKAELIAEALRFAGGEDRGREPRYNPAKTLAAASILRFCWVDSQGW
jgi:coenzyme F420-reducing hydrogenase delta subunit